MSITVTRALGLAAALLAPFLVGAAAASAAAPDPVAACDGTAFTTAVVSGRDVVSCDDGGIRDWQRVAIADASVVRGTGGGAVLSFLVSRPEAGSPVFLRVRTIAGTAAAGSDFTAQDDVLVLEADQTSATVAVPVRSQAGPGDDRTLGVQLSDEQGGVVEFARDAATGTIRNGAITRTPDGDNACNGGLYDIVTVDGWRTVNCLAGVNGHRTVAARAVTVDPRAGIATFELRREGWGGPIGLAYTTADGSARAGVDYVATSGSLVMTGEQTVARIAVPLLDAQGADGDRDFSLRLSTASPAQTSTLTDGGATIRRFTPALTGAATAQVGVALAAAAPGAATRQWQRCDAQGACWAIAGATAEGYVPTAADLGRRLRVRATAPGDGGASIVAVTPLTAEVAAANVDPDPSERPAPRTDPEPQPQPRANPQPQPRADPQPQPRADPQPQPRADPQPLPPSAASRLRVTGRRQQNRPVADVVAGRTNVVLRCSQRCTLTAPLTISRRDARRLGLRSATIGRASGSGAGLVRLRVRIDARAQQRLLALRAPLTIVAQLANPAGGAVAVSFGVKPRAGRR